MKVPIGEGAQRQLETVYASSAEELESLYLQVEGDATRVQDIVQLLKATQMDRGASVQTAAEVAIASDVLEALVSAPRLAASAKAGASSGSTSVVVHPLPDVPEKVSDAEPAAGIRVKETNREIQAEPAASIGAGRTFTAVGLSLMIVALLMMCVVQYRKYETPIPPPAPVRATPAPPPIALKAPAVPIVHRAQIKALQSTWVGISADGHKIFGATIPKGSSKDLEYSQIAFLHAGNAAGIEVTVDGQTVPRGAKPSLRLVELNTTGYRLLRWMNDDPPDTTPSSKHD
jgi:hypothetical protein